MYRNLELCWRFYITFIRFFGLSSGKKTVDKSFKKQEQQLHFKNVGNMKMVYYSRETLQQPLNQEFSMKYLFSTIIKRQN